jgi:hypothetical protein
VQLEKAIEEARWRLGDVRIAPWIGLRDVTYVRELDAQGREQQGDLNVTAGAGLKAYLKLGEHAMAAAHALPEYSWWQRQDERSAVVGRYGLGLFGWFNRLQGEVTARRVEAVDFLSSDLLVREAGRNDALAASGQLRLFGSIALFAASSTNRTRIDATSGLEPRDPAQLLDRDNTELRAGLRYLLRGNRGHLGAGVLQERTEFQGADAVRSNKGSSWYAESLVRGNHIDISLRYDQRNLEPDDSTFPGYDAANGLASVILHPGWRLQYQLYTRQELRYSAQSVGTYSEEQRTGIGIHSAIAKGGVQLFYERGDDDYFGTSTRHEEVTARGGWLDWSIRKLNLRLGSRRTRFTPDVGAEREVRELTAALSLTLGQPGEW